MAVPGEEIMVECRKGPYSYRYRGTLHFLNPKDVQVDDLFIPYIDMVPKSRVRLDKKTNKKAKDEYVEKKVQDYQRDLSLKRL